MIGCYANCPAWIIDLSKLNHSSGICEIMKNKRIVNYVYIFSCTNGVLKYGYSADNSRNYGDRIYRQAGHLNGWGRRLGGSSGSDMRIISDNYYSKYNTVLDRSNVKLTVIDLSNYGIPGTQEEHCKNLERMLIDDCIIRNGAAPIGNIDNVTESNVRKYKNTKQLERLFEIL
jgi:hypothetical protein